MRRGQIQPEAELCLWAGRPEPFPEPCQAVRLEIVDPSNVHELAEAMQVPPALVSNRLAGSRCFVARLGHTLASYAWVSRNETPIGEVHGSLRPGPGEAYIWDCATLPASRGRGLYTTLLRGLLTELAKNGVQHVWIGALEHNLPANRALQAVGFRRVLRVQHACAARRWLLQPAAGASSEEFEQGCQALRLPGHGSLNTLLPCAAVALVELSTGGPNRSPAADWRWEKAG